MPLLEFNTQGIYCPQADVYIDPWKPVKKALITHGHSDHARWGHAHYLCTKSAAPIIRYRLGQDIQLETIEYGEELIIHGVKISFHPAGHIIGSAQIRLEYKGEIWVVSGDYKLEDDGLSEVFYPIRCHVFITESTFGLPIYRWKPQTEIFDDINTWWRQNKEEGKISVLLGYSLGKAQRILKNLDHNLGAVYTHGAIEQVHEVIRSQKIDLPVTHRIWADLPRKQIDGSLVLAPPSVVGSPWLQKLQPNSTGIASGWMALRGTRRRRGADRGFILSDHADWEGLIQTIRETGAEKIFVTHGYTDILSKWLNEQGWEAATVSTQFEGETQEQTGTEEEAQ